MGLQLVLRLDQHRLLALERLGLLLELHVGFLQLCLLGLETCLGLLQRAALLLQFLVGDTQLLLLRLQLLALALRLLEQLDETLAIDRRAQREADRLGAQGEQRQVALERVVLHAREAQLHDALDRTVGDDGPDREVARRAAPERGDEVEMARRHVDDPAGRSGTQHLAEQPVVDALPGRECRGRGPFAADEQQRLALEAVDRADLGTEHLAQRAKRRLRDRLDRLLAEQRPRDAALALLEPQQAPDFGAALQHLPDRASHRAMRQRAQPPVDHRQFGVHPGGRRQHAERAEERGDGGDRERQARSRLKKRCSNR